MDLSTPDSYAFFPMVRWMETSSKLLKLPNLNEPELFMAPFSCQNLRNIRLIRTKSNKTIKIQVT